MKIRPVIPRNALRELVATLTGLECVWGDEKHGPLGASGGSRAWVKLRPGVLTTSGDEYRQTPNPKNANVFDVRITNNTQFVVAMTASSYETSLRPDEVLLHVRAGLQSVTSGAVYAEQNIAFVTAHPITPFRGQTGAGRAHERLDAQMDVVFATVGGYAPDDDPGTTIGQVNGGTGIPITTT